MLGGDVLKAIDRPLDDALSVFEGPDVDQCHDARSVSTLDQHFLVARRGSRLECPSHRAIFERERGAVGQEKSIGTAETITALSQCGRSPPQGRRLAVVPDQPAVVIAQVHRARNRIERAGTHRQKTFVIALRARLRGKRFYV